MLKLKLPVKTDKVHKVNNSKTNRSNFDVDTPIC